MNVPLLTTREVAAFLNVSTETVLRWWRADPKKIPGGRRVNGVLRFRADVIEEWVEADATCDMSEGRIATSRCEVL